VILGRPTNLWLGFVTALVGFASVSAVAVFHADPAVVATVGGSATGLLGAGVVLVAGQPPTLSPGDTFHVQTPNGQPNQTTTVATPPAHDAPPVPEPQP
jgi:hypothetical protein